ncbi:MAG: GGDEF domain-containing protein [Treponema sp.]|nr:GGDEF domain-containing protein [Treponema sp.]MBR5033090.1 GGDEF domain-containing protein [Treponema sp.]
MSKKKEKRIKRLRKNTIWPQFIEVILVELAFITAITIVLTVNFSSETHDLIVHNADTCKTIVEYVNTDWDSETKTLGPDAQQELSNIIKYDYETIGAINIVDDDFNVLASFGDRNINDSTYKKYFDRSSFEENGFYFTEQSSVYEVIDNDDDAPNVFLWFTKKDMQVLNLFKNHFNIGFDSLNDKQVYDWAISKDSQYTMWMLYKTDIPGINAAIEKRSVRKMLEMGRLEFLIVILIFVFVFIWFYEHYKLISIILQRRKIKKLIYTDPATGGQNKDFFLYKAGKLIKKRHRSYVIVCLRMEKFRNYQTAYGIKAGDNLLEDFYKKLNELIKRRQELAAHLEKGDFVLLLHFDNKELLDIRMQIIMDALNDCRKNQHLFFEAGACRILTRADNLEEKISNAGAALSKQEKSSDKVLWFDESMREEQVWERHVEDDMDKALANNEFQVYLQPKYSTKKEELSAAEALVRWIHPEYGFVSPGKFIPIFEKNGFIIKLDDFMLTEVAKLQAQWLEQGKKLVPISVNVSRAHFSRDDLAEHICNIVDEYKVPHEFIELELTESAFFDDKQALLGTVKKLKDFGFKVSMDDFGAGYSSLNSLKELPLDIIKLDAQFFREIDDKKRADLIVGDTIKLAKKLGMQIVAEGIETREQVDFLADQHCDLIQGFYFAKPLPIEEFEERAFPAGEKASKGDKA